MPKLTLSLTQWPKINRFPPLIINSLHVKFKCAWAKTVVCIVLTRFHRQRAKLDPDLLPSDPKSIGFLLFKISSIAYIWKLEVIGQNFKSVLCPQGVKDKTECQIWPWPLIQLPKINRVFTLIMINLRIQCTKIESLSCNAYTSLKSNRNRSNLYIVGISNEQGIQKNDDSVT